MKLRDRVAVVTGGANGIGRALCRRFAAEQARGVVVADMDAGGAEAVAREVGGLSVTVDVSIEADIVRLVEQVIDTYGRVDVFCSNAGIGSTGGAIEASNEDWQRSWDVNYMPHVYAARAVVPGMLERGEGYLLQTASAAGLLNHFESAPYAVSKHAVVALAEWLAITYADRGIKVSCLCPQGVRTRMLLGEDGGRESFLLAGAVEPEDAAEAVIRGIDAERFLILPHPEVAEFYRRKGDDPDRWLMGMRRLRDRAVKG